MSDDDCSPSALIDTQSLFLWGPSYSISRAGLYPPTHPPPHTHVPWPPPPPLPLCRHLSCREGSGDKTRPELAPPASPLSLPSLLILTPAKSPLLCPSLPPLLCTCQPHLGPHRPGVRKGRRPRGVGQQLAGHDRHSSWMPLPAPLVVVAVSPHTQRRGSLHRPLLPPSPPPVLGGGWPSASLLCVSVSLCMYIPTPPCSTSHRSSSW